MDEKNASGNNQQEAASLDFIFDEVKQRLEAQRHQTDALDSKASAVLGSSALFIATASAVQSLRALPGQTISQGVVWLFGFTALLLVLAMGAAFAAYRVRTYRGDPEPRPLRDHYLHCPMEKTKRKLLANLIESFEANQREISGKVRMVKAAITLMALGTVSLVATVAYVVWSTA